MQCAADQGWAIAALVEVVERFDGAHQHRARVAFVLGDGVEAVVHAVDEIDVRHARRPVHDRGTPLLANPRVRGRIVGPDIRLGLHNPPRSPLTIGVVDQDFAQHLARHHQRRPRVEIPPQPQTSRVSNKFPFGEEGIVQWVDLRP